MMTMGYVGFWHLSPLSPQKKVDSPKKAPIFSTEKGFNWSIEGGRTRCRASTTGLTLATVQVSAGYPAWRELRGLAF